MALIKCPECGKEISSEAEHCIHCGFPLKKKQVKEETKDDNPDKMTGKFVVGYRGGPGGIIAIDIVGIIFGVILTTGFIILAFTYGFMVFVSFIVLAILGFFLLFLPIYDFIYIGINKANKNDCVIYDADRKKLILYTTTGKRIEIKPTDYLDLKVNFFTSNVLKFTYRVGERKYKKVTLGYCSNREELRNNLRKVIVDYEHNKIRN